MKILLIEDDEMVASSIMLALRNSGYVVERLSNTSGAELAITTSQFDVLVLDLGLPGVDGLEFLKGIRKKKIKVPCLILTARDSYDDRIKGLDCGANDYVTKPFHLGELEARIRAILRVNCDNTTTVDIGELSFDTVGKVLRRGDKIIELSPREYSVLEILVHNIGGLVSKNRLATSLSDWDSPVTYNALDIIIHKLRKKLEPFGVKLQTIRGLGFLLEQ